MSRIHFYTAGESHGKGLVAIVEGMVAGLPLQAGYINRELKRRSKAMGVALACRLKKTRLILSPGCAMALR